MWTKTNKLLVFAQPKYWWSQELFLIWEIHPTELLLWLWFLQMGCYSALRSNSSETSHTLGWSLFTSEEGGGILSASSTDEAYGRLVVLCSADICLDSEHGNNGGGLPSWRHRQAARGEQDRGAAARSGQLVPGSLLSQRRRFPLRSKLY